MNIEWEKIIFKIVFWLAVEVVLNLIGIDDLADYSEFVLTPKIMIRADRCATVI